MLIPLLCVTGQAGCRVPPVGRPPRTSSPAIGQPITFSQALYCKPSSEQSLIDPYQAPLLVVEDEDALGRERGPQFGHVQIINQQVHVETREPTVYFHSTTTAINNRPYVQHTFVWFYASPSSETTEAPVQGVRITFDAQKRPVIWEVLCTQPPKRVYYVSRRLETAAARHFGGPLPERRFAIERSSTVAPDVFVAGILDDSPVPLGPIVYLSDPSHAVSAVICRCMSSLAESFSGTFDYDLQALDTIDGIALWWPQWMSSDPQGRWQVNFMPLEPQLELPELRLPPDF